MAQNRHALCNRLDLGKLVRDKDDASALFDDALHLAEELLHLIGGQYRGRFVEHENPDPVRKAANNLHALPERHRE